MDAFTISPVKEQDLAAVSDIFLAAFYNNPRALSYHIFSRHHAAEVADWSLRNTEFMYHNTPNTLFYKLVHEQTGDTAGYLVLQTPRKIGSPAEETRRKEEKLKTQERLKKVVGLPPATDGALFDSFENEQDQLREKHVHEGRDFVVKFVAILPTHQGQGGGSKLVRFLLEMVDHALARVYLEATPQGKPIYEKYGWKEVDRVVSEVPIEDGVYQHITTCMMREPRGPVT